MLPSLVLYPGNGTSAWFQKEDMSLGKSFRGANQSLKHSRNGMSQREVHQSHITGCRVLTLLLWKQITSCPLAPQACKYLRTLWSSSQGDKKCSKDNWTGNNRYNSSHGSCIHANMIFFFFDHSVSRYSYFLQAVVRQHTAESSSIRSIRSLLFFFKRKMWY